jgi:hypothetical protein
MLQDGLLMINPLGLYWRKQGGGALPLSEGLGRVAKAPDAREGFNDAVC